jgi:hypothetical protein
MVQEGSRCSGVRADKFALTPKHPCVIIATSEFKLTSLQACKLASREEHELCDEQVF